MTQELKNHQNEIINRKEELVKKIIENLDRSNKIIILSIKSELGFNVY
jgi:hypothetical protein